VTANGPRGTRRSEFSAGQYANEHEGHDDLHEDPSEGADASDRTGVQTT
jgi:hypothetical protein